MTARVGAPGHFFHKLTAALRTAGFRCAGGFVVALAAASPAAAQRLPSLLGSSVRMEVDSGLRVTGVVVAQTSDSLGLRVDDGRAYSAALAHVQHVERYAPRRSGWGALGGFLAGGAVGYVAGVYAMNRGIAACRATPGHNDMCGVDFVTVPIFTLGGVIAGTTVGALVKLPHWERVF